jgi:superfamily II DNA/RNA helicase
VFRQGRTGRAGHTGQATAFVNEKNQNIAKDLIEVLAEATQDVPDFLHRLVKPIVKRGGRSNKRGKGKGKGKGGRGYGGMDYRAMGGHGMSGFATVNYT